jgi:hypothetical protein
MKCLTNLDIQGLTTSRGIGTLHVLKFGKAQTETGMAITLMKLEGEKTLPLK